MADKNSEFFSEEDMKNLEYEVFESKNSKYYKKLFKSLAKK